jgi:hypothetical protein
MLSKNFVNLAGFSCNCMVVAGLHINFDKVQFFFAKLLVIKCGGGGFS